MQEEGRVRGGVANLVWTEETSTGPLKWLGENVVFLRTWTDRREEVERREYCRNFQNLIL